MGYNSKEIKVISTAKETKSNPFKEDVITDLIGQWKYPGKVTKINSNEITMKGVDYPVLGVDNLGNKKMMYPGADYTFPGSSVTEYPQMHMMPDGNMMKDSEMKKGGWLDDIEVDDDFKKGGTHFLKTLSRNKTKRNIQTSLNFLMTRNYDIHGLAGKRFYDPDAKFETGGWLDKYK